jgi:hypothetical protein
MSLIKASQLKVINPKLFEKLASVIETKRAVTNPCLHITQDVFTLSPTSKAFQDIFGSGIVDAQKFIIEHNFLGQGGNAKVYAINEKYVLRVPHSGFTEGKVDVIDHPLSPLNFGQPILKIGNAEVLVRQNGIPAGVPHGPIRKAGGEKALKIYTEHLERSATMPQDAYDDLAKQLLYIQKKGYVFDPSKSNNILVDPSESRLNLVDLNPQDPRSTYRHSVTDIIVPLIDNAYCWQVEDTLQIIQNRKAIIAKCLRAAKKKGLPINYDDSSLSYAFKLAQMEVPKPASIKRVAQ